MATLKDVAAAAGVSVATASYALNNRPEVNDETKRKVFEIASRMNYRPNGTARDLKMRSTNTVGLILSSLSGPFYSGLIKGIEEITFASGYNLIVCSSYGGLNSTAVKFLNEKRTDGVIILASDISNDIIRQVANEDFPVVLMDRDLKSDYVWSVMIDNRKGAYDATSHLIGIGYRDIGYFSGPGESLDNQQRLEGYQSAMQDKGLACNPKWSLCGHFTREGGRQAAQTLIASRDIPEAIFCANDEMAIGTIEAFLEAGVQVPERVAIVGFDDIELSSYIRPALTTIRHPKYLLGRVATRTLMQALNKDFNMEDIKLGIDLVVRDSCGYKLKKSREQ